MKKILLFMLLLLISPGLASAALVHYYDFEDGSGTTLSDTVGSNDFTLSGTPTWVSGDYPSYNNTGNGSDYSLEMDGTNPTDDYGYTNTAWLSDDADFSVCVWTKLDATTEEYLISTADADVKLKEDFLIQVVGGTVSFRKHVADSNQGAKVEGSVSAGSYAHICGTYNESVGGDPYGQGGLNLYVDGVIEDDTSANDDFNGWSIPNEVWLGAIVSTYLEMDGHLDELRFYDHTLNSTEVANLYNYGNITAPAPPAPGNDTASERLQQDYVVKQNGTVTVNSVTYVPIVSASVTVPDTGAAYATATIPITATASNTADCRITYDGSLYGSSEASRSLTAGESGNLIINSIIENVTSGAHDFGIQCKRTGGGAFDVTNSTLLGHLLISADGDQITHEEINVTGSLGTVYSSTITASENETADGLYRTLIGEWSASITYGATGNATITPEIAGTNCTPIIRYGASGSTGSAAGACHAGNLTNSTSYDIKLHTAGTGTIAGNFIVKEIILHPGEVNTTSLSGANFEGNDTQIANSSITVSAGHSTPDAIVYAAVNPSSNTGSVSGTYYVSDGTTRTSSISRTVDTGEPGSIAVQDAYSGVTGAVVYTLFGSCTDCEIVGGDFLTYLSSDVAATPNTFDVTLRDVYENNTINEFSISLSDNRSFSTTTGSITVFLEDDLTNVTFTAQNSTAIPYWENTTLNHNKSGNLVGYVTPWTVIRAFNSSVVQISNYTVTWDSYNVTTDNGSSSTTSGIVYVPINNATYNITVSNAIDNASNIYADTSKDLTGTPYLKEFNFTLPPPYVNITFFDEINNTLLDSINISLSLIASDETAVNYSTSNGNIYIENPDPDNYTLRYESPLFGIRDYFINFRERSNMTITLYMISTAESSLLPIRITDYEGRELEGATVHLQRYYTEESGYITVEMTKTASGGSSNFYFEAYDAWYKPIIYYEGYTQTGITGRRLTPADASNGVTWRIDTTQDQYESWLPIIGIIADNDITYSSATREFSYTYSDTTGVVNEVCLNVYELNRRTKTALNSTCSTAASATIITAHAATNNTVQAEAVIDTNTENSVYTAAVAKIESFAQSSASVFGGIGIFITSLFIAVLALVSGAHPAIPIFMGVLGLIGGWLGLGLAVSTASIIMIAIVGFGLVALFAWRFGR